MDSFADTRRLDRAFVDECWSLITQEFRHLAVIGPAGGATASLLDCLADRATRCEHQTPPHIVRLPCRKLTSSDHEGMLAYFADQLGVSITDSIRGLSTLSQRLPLLFESARLTVPSLWLMVEDVVELPLPLARQLLWAFQECAVNPRLQRHISVIVTGSSDFIPLSFTQNSPYHHAHRFLLAGLGDDLGREFVERRIRFHQMAADAIDSRAFDYLMNATGGSPHLIQEVIGCAFRLSRWREENPPPDSWSEDYVRKLVAHFRDEVMPADQFCASKVEDLVRRAERFDVMRMALDAGDGTTEGAADAIHGLEAAGLLVPHEENEWQAKLSCPLWSEYLSSTLTQRFRADAYGIQGRWDIAWNEYREMPSSYRDRPTSGDAASRLLEVVERWSGGLMELAFEGVEAVYHQFALGARYLLGIDRLAVYEERDTRGSHPLVDLRQLIPPCDRFRPTNVSASDLINTSVAVQVVPGVRPRMWSRDQAAELRERGGARPMVCMERDDPTREFVETERTTINRALARFWQALVYASDVAQRRKLAEAEAIRARAERWARQVDQARSQVSDLEMSGLVSEEALAELRNIRHFLAEIGQDAISLRD